MLLHLFSPFPVSTAEERRGTKTTTGPKKRRGSEEAEQSPAKTRALPLVSKIRVGSFVYYQAQAQASRVSQDILVTHTPTLGCHCGHQ